MKDLSFGITVTIVGMGVTFFSLALLAVICVGLRKALPYKEEEGADKE